MSDVEAPGEGKLFESEQPGVGDLVQSSVAKDFHQGLMISDDDEIVTALGEVASLLEAPGYRQGLPFNSRVALLCRGQEP